MRRRRASVLRGAALPAAAVLAALALAGCPDRTPTAPPPIEPPPAEHPLPRSTDGDPAPPGNGESVTISQIWVGYGKVHPSRTREQARQVARDYVSKIR